MPLQGLNKISISVLCIVQQHNKLVNQLRWILDENIKSQLYLLTMKSNLITLITSKPWGCVLWLLMCSTYMTLSQWRHNVRAIREMEEWQRALVDHQQHEGLYCTSPVGLCSCHTGFQVTFLTVSLAVLIVKGTYTTVRRSCAAWVMLTVIIYGIKLLYMVLHMELQLLYGVIKQTPYNALNNMELLLLYTVMLCKFHMT